MEMNIDRIIGIIMGCLLAYIGICVAAIISVATYVGCYRMIKSLNPQTPEIKSVILGKEGNEKIDVRYNR